MSRNIWEEFFSRTDLKLEESFYFVFLALASGSANIFAVIE